MAVKPIRPPRKRERILGSDSQVGHASGRKKSQQASQTRQLSFDFDAHIEVHRILALTETWGIGDELLLAIPPARCIRCEAKLMESSPIHQQRMAPSPMVSFRSLRGAGHLQAIMTYVALVR